MASWDLALAEESFKHAKDLESLLLLYTSSGSREGLEYLAKVSRDECKNNIAFTCQFALGNLNECVDLLVATKRYTEAVFFAKTYKPSLVAELVKKWKESLIKGGKKKIAKSIASPDGNLDLFPSWTEYLETERSQRNENLNNGIVFGVND